MALMRKIQTMLFEKKNNNLTLVGTKDHDLWWSLWGEGGRLVLLGLLQIWATGRKCLDTGNIGNMRRKKDQLFFEVEGFSRLGILVGWLKGSAVFEVTIFPKKRDLADFTSFSPAKDCGNIAFRESDFAQQGDVTNTCSLEHLCRKHLGYQFGIVAVLNSM